MDFDESVAALKVLAGLEVGVSTVLDGDQMHLEAHGLLAVPEPHFLRTPLGYAPPFADDQAVFEIAGLRLYVNRRDFVEGHVDDEVIVLQLTATVELSVEVVTEIIPL